MTISLTKFNEVIVKLINFITTLGQVFIK